jgi:hypothetical protein
MAGKQRQNGDPGKKGVEHFVFNAHAAITNRLFDERCMAKRSLTRNSSGCTFCFKHFFLSEEKHWPGAFVLVFCCTDHLRELVCG